MTDVPLKVWIENHDGERDKPIPDGTLTIIPIKNQVQKWAACNAFTLIFVSSLSTITWILLILVSYGVIGAK